MRSNILNDFKRDTIFECTKTVYNCNYGFVKPSIDSNNILCGVVYDTLFACEILTSAFLQPVNKSHRVSMLNLVAKTLPLPQLRI